MQKLAEGDHEQRSIKQETEQQTVDLTKQIKILQDQLLEVSESRLAPRRLKLYKCIILFWDLQSRQPRFQGLLALLGRWDPGDKIGS